ncbi:MAG: hypothetical protein ACJ0HT_02405 [Alphaproteobacteria bacterium]
MDEKAVHLSPKAKKQMGKYISALKEIRDHIEKNSDNVGKKFPKRPVKFITVRQRNAVFTERRLQKRQRS